MAALRCRQETDAATLGRIHRLITSQNPAHLSIEDKGEYALGIAACQYVGADKVSGRATILGTIRELEAFGIRNSIYLMLLFGLGVMEGDLGDYEEEIRVLEAAIYLARKLGNDRRYRHSAANIANAHGRLGNRHEQLRWAILAEGIEPDTRTLFLHHQIHLNKAKAYALMGKEEEARLALNASRRFANSKNDMYLAQAWFLRTADILSLLGHHSEALGEVAPGITGEYASLQSDKFAGPFARWLAQSAALGQIPLADAQARILKLWTRESSLDWIDQFEVLNAKVWLDHQSGTIITEELDELRSRLAAVPAGALEEFHRLGMLDI